MRDAYLSPLAPLRAHLLVHGGHHILRGVDVADLVTQALDAPVEGGLVDHTDDVGVEGGAIRQRPVQGELANFSAHGSLRELGDGKRRILHPIGCLGVCVCECVCV